MILFPHSRKASFALTLPVESVNLSGDRDLELMLALVTSPVKRNRHISSDQSCYVVVLLAGGGLGFSWRVWLERTGMA